MKTYSFSVIVIYLLCSSDSVGASVNETFPTVLVASHYANTIPADFHLFL